MGRRILIINGNPDPSPSRLSAALADAYVHGARRGGHEVRRIDIGALDFPPVLNGEDLDQEAPAVIRDAQEAITWAEHITIIFPLWLGAPPALMKSYFEQICRYGFSFSHDLKPLLKGRTARLIITMVLPNFVFRLMFAQGVKGFVRSVFWSSGIKPTRILALGKVMTAAKKPWLAQVEKLGERGI